MNDYESWINQDPLTIMDYGFWAFAFLLGIP